MKQINLRDLYPDVYKEDTFVEVSDEIQAVFQSAQRAEAAYNRQRYRYKAHYSLDRGDGIEHNSLARPLTPEMILEDNFLKEQVYAAVMSLPELQARVAIGPILFLHPAPPDCSSAHWMNFSFGTTMRLPTRNTGKPGVCITS